jgi:nucleoside-diphosphate-sugar epimerase
MRVLFIGGSGNISTPCSRLAVERGVELVHFKRGLRKIDLPKGVRAIRGDMSDRRAMAQALARSTRNRPSTTWSARPRPWAALSGSTRFDNAKIKRLVPEFRCTVPLGEGLRRTIAWLDAHPEEQRLASNAAIEEILKAWNR